MKGTKPKEEKWGWKSLFDYDVGDRDHNLHQFKQGSIDSRNSMTKKNPDWQSDSKKTTDWQSDYNQTTKKTTDWQ